VGSSQNGGGPGSATFTIEGRSEELGAAGAEDPGKDPAATAREYVCAAGDPAISEPTPAALIAHAAQLAAGRYHKLSELARGGSGRIMTARDLVFDRLVAIKEPLEAARDGTRLRAEAEILACLQHPSIVPVYDTGLWSDGTPFFAMKLVEGRSLKHAICDAPEPAQRLSLIPHLVAVADAIAYAHAQGVIHRDLKPGNVLVGQFGETVVIDWGLAKRVRVHVAPDAADQDLHPGRGRGAVESATGAVLGTPAYMAPEQARGERVDERTDVYALGAMLYHVLTGDAPFRGAAASDIIAAVGAGRPVPVEELQPRAPADLVAIVTKAMALQPSDRYPTAAELADDLRRFQTGRLVTARRYSPIARLRRWLRKHRGVMFGVALAGASATAAILAMPSAPPPGAQCAHSGEAIRALWDPDHHGGDRAAAVRAALRATGRVSADDVFARVSASLDRYTHDWVAARVEACTATRVRGE
jgi:eukaryotic-like serine/threonine-protein kinase